MRTLFLLAAVASLASFALVGCAADNESEGGTGLPKVAHSAPAAAGDAPVEEPRFATSDTTTQHGPSSASGSDTCRVGAFCEGFESSAYASNWAAAVTTGNGVIELGHESASQGFGSLHLTTREKNSSAYMLRENGAVGSQWSGSLSFAFRVNELPGSYLGGPELTVKTPVGPVYVRVFVTPDGIFLEQNATAACSAERCPGSRTFISTAHANHWYNIVVGLEVNDRSSAPYGLVETSVNGGDFVTNDLTVPLSGGSLFLKAGITVGDPGAYAVADLDDVSLLVH